MNDFIKRSDSIQGLNSYRIASTQHTPAGHATFKVSKKALQKRYQKIIQSLRTPTPTGNGSLNNKDAQELLNRFK
jgi:hypothetical protein